MGNYFSSHLKQLREDRKISQGELADSIGINRATISKYERGIIAPTLDVVKSIAEYFNISIEELVNPNYDTNSEVINSVNASELYGFKKEYIEAIKFASSKNISPQKLIELINFASTF